MGMVIFESSGTFYPATYGLKVGDELNIICVGGGQGGRGYSKGGNGASSSFGNIVTARGGSDTTGQYINDNGCLGGCGGFVLGSNDWGGIGWSKNSKESFFAPPGSAGRADAHSPSNKYEGLSYGGGNAGGSYGRGGGGYGAGGGGSEYQGGNSGEVKYATYKLSNLNSIRVLVGGGGGGGGYYSGDDGTTSSGGNGGDRRSFDDRSCGAGGNGGYGGVRGKTGQDGKGPYGNGSGYCGGGGGAGGCVIVFW